MSHPEDFPENTGDDVDDVSDDELRELLSAFGLTQFIPEPLSYNEAQRIIAGVHRRLEAVDIASALGGKIVGKAKDWQDGPFGVGRLAKWVKQRTSTPFLYEESLEGGTTFVLSEHRIDRDIFDQLTVLANEASSAGKKITPKQVAFQLLLEVSTLSETLKKYFHSQE